MLTPHDIGLPEKFDSWRPGQLQTAAKITATEKYAFLLDAPTGSGKSLIAAAFQKLTDKCITYVCLTENNTIPTDCGYKGIKDLNIGNQVWTGSCYEPISDKGSRWHMGLVYTIKTAYKADESLEVTREHEVLAVRGGNYHKSDLRTQKKEMIQAGDVVRGDWLVYPAAVRRTQSHTSYKDEFVELCAWYVAEGFTGKNKQVFFALSEEETDNIARLKELIRIITGKEASTSDRHESTVELYVYHPDFVRFLESNFGRGAVNKTLPDWLFWLSEGQQELFLRTYCKGDGSVIKGSKAKSFTNEFGTSSRSLALGIRELAMQCGYLPTISTRDYKPGVKIMGRVIKNAHRGYIIRYRDGKGIVKDARSVNDGEYVYLKVLDVRYKAFSGWVYDITVPSGKFCTVAATVHNCTTKQLQDQLLHDFPYARTLKGRNNYPCLKFRNMFPSITAEMCTHTETNECALRGGCPYLIDKRRALEAPLAVLNVAYFLSEANFVGGFSERGPLVVDEFDTIEDQLMSFVELAVTKKQLENLNIPPPKYKTKFESWVEWARPTYDELYKENLELEKETTSAWGTPDVKTFRRKILVSRLLSKLKFFVREVDKTWVWYPGDDRWSFKPTWVSKYANGVLWKHTSKLLGMSATILDPRQTSLNTGLIYGAERKYDYLALPSPFPKEHRPVYYEPCANIVNKQMDIALPRLARAVSKIMEKYPNERILIHTVSYKVRDYLKKNIQSDRFITHSTADRISILEMFKQSKEPLVLLSPSMDRGVDLPGEECRVVVIAKMPYPDLGDPQVSRRVHASKDGNDWYAHRTISSVVQMSGRACRSVEDRSTTYILDEQFEKLYNEHRNVFPQWWKEALVM